MENASIKTFLSFLVIFLSYQIVCIGENNFGVTEREKTYPVLLLPAQDIFIKNVPVDSQATIEIPITNNGNSELLITDLKGSCFCLAPNVEKIEIPPKSMQYLPITYTSSKEEKSSGPYLINFKTNDPHRPQQFIKMEFGLIENKEEQESKTFRLPQKPASYLLGESSTLNLGNIDSHVEVIKTWSFRNQGNSPLVIERVGLSCGNCLKLISRTPIEIDPGEGGSLEIEFDPAGISGPFSHRAVVFSNDPTMPRYELEITGNSKRTFYVFPKDSLYPYRGKGRFLLALEEPSLDIEDFKISSDILKVENILPRFWTGNERRYLVEGTIPNGINLSDVEISICVQKDDSATEIPCYNIGAKKQMSGEDTQAFSSDIIALKNHEILGEYYLGIEGKQISLAEGTFLIALLSEDCEHCAETVGELNNLLEHPDCPQMVGLILGEPSTLQSFRDSLKPRFPVELISAKGFFSLVGTAPPRFILTIDGRPVQYWDGELPQDITSQIVSIIDQI